MPGHNAALVLFGCLLTLVGWFGLTIGQDPTMLVLAAINTVLAAAAGAIAALVGTRVRFGKPDASLTANGWVAGLVAISASAPYVKPVSAMLIGFVAGGAIVFAIEIVELRMGVDDPAGAISVHAVGGTWGLLAVSIFADGRGPFLAQALGIATLIGFVLPVSYGLNWLMNRFVPYRVSASGERQGMDLFELGAGAYPEFVTQREDFMRR
jgi:Amt family ammonium transporter